ncbi:Xan family putative trans-acting RiPP leader peptide [Archangium violaceum]|uniref:Xan family putative trans-acting RiPP leader peptide n=1 Tax=Archangium violaceum TaxID=83451 RepID=UPI002B28B4D6|nr:Xan family putative trans-acting RiPP leader peptide [Archangium gephyra]
MAAEETTSAHPVESSVASTPREAAAPDSAPEKLDELEEINFLLEEIESKIAPLALA